MCFCLRLPYFFVITAMIYLFAMCLSYRCVPHHLDTRQRSPDTATIIYYGFEYVSLKYTELPNIA
jgi:hypothetical protein